MKSVTYIISGDNISLYINGRPYNIEPSHPNFKKIKDALSATDYSQIEILVDVPRTISKWTKGAVSVASGEVCYDGVPVDNYVANKILQFMEEGLPFAPLVAFLERLMKNPSKKAVDGLYRFLEYKNMPLDDEGYFYAYKAVRADWFDKHSGKIRNMIGDKPEVPRNTVDDNEVNECSYGLHAGTIQYVNDFRGPGDHVVIVKIDPADVVTIPACDVTKLRCCRYEVVGEMTELLSDTMYSTPSTACPDDDDEYEDDEEQDDDVCPNCGYAH